MNPTVEIGMFTFLVTELIQIACMAALLTTSERYRRRLSSARNELAVWKKRALAANTK